MASNVYEGLFIFDANRYARDPGNVSGQLGQLVEQHGGEVLASRLWEERRLAYPIKGQRKGAYWLMYFRLSTDRLAALNRQLRLNDNVLRSLCLKVDPRIVDPLVSHALSTQGPVSERQSKAEAAEVGADSTEPAAELAVEEV